jgi:hypothetical protein
VPFVVQSVGIEGNPVQTKMSDNPLCKLYEREPDTAKIFLRKNRGKGQGDIKIGLAQYIYLKENVHKIDVSDPKNYDFCP